MWQLKNTTPFEAQGYFVRDRQGVEHWVVALRARFAATADGLVRLADEQKPVRLAPDYVDDTASELQAESDFAPFRSKVDFTLSGRACEPGLRPFKAMTASISVGAFRKEAAISCERRLSRPNGRPVIDYGDAVDGVDLTWSNCLGGADRLATGENAGECPENPVGRGWTEHWSRLPKGAEIALPSIEAADRRITPGTILPQPFGFGPVQPHWAPRREYAGTYDAAWRKQRAPLLPDDFDDRFHQAAPADQQLDLKGGETIGASGLHPDGPFSFRLPQLILEASTQIGRDRHEARLRLIAVALDCRTRHVDMVWNADVRCSGRDTEVAGSTIRLRQMSGVTR